MNWNREWLDPHDGTDDDLDGEPDLALTWDELGDSEFVEPDVCPVCYGSGYVLTVIDRRGNQVRRVACSCQRPPLAA